MSVLNLNTKEFADIAMIWLFDHIMNPEQITNENFMKFVVDHRSKIRTPLMTYYLDSDPDMRRQYKRIKGVFDGEDNSIQQIRIGPSEKLDKENEKEGKLKKLVRSVIKAALKKEKIKLTNDDRELLKEMEIKWVTQEQINQVVKKGGITWEN